MTTIVTTRLQPRAQFDNHPRPHPPVVGTGLKVAVVLPALNEEATVAAVIGAVPRHIPGVRAVDVIVIDDGSTDETVARAYAAGANSAVRHARSRGLVAVFNRAVTEALRSGADVLVQLDSDGQHDPTLIPSLVQPILEGRADIVVGARPLAEAREMSRGRRVGNRVGSWFFRRILGLPVSDFTSGYRALSRTALLSLNPVSDYTYTVETLVQAARLRLAVVEVPVPVVPRAFGESRMTSSPLRYIGRTGGQALRSIINNSPLAAFGRAAVVTSFATIGFAGWFVWGYHSGGMHLPSLLAAVLGGIFTVGLFVAGIVADGIKANRRLLEDALYRLKALDASPAFVAARGSTARRARSA